MKDAIQTFIQTTDLEHSLLIGYYGGGNYGDELLLETLAQLLQKHSVRTITITYQKPKTYPTYHHNFGYDLVPMGDKKELLRTMAKNKNLIVGGGGLWGLDVNFNIFLLSCMLFFARFILRKNVYLIGVGYYNSTSRLGHLSAWFAGKAAKRIIARDQESFQNFRKISRHVWRDRDLAWQIPALDLADYSADLKSLEKTVRATGKTLFITLRRFKPHQHNRYAELIAQCIGNNPDKNILVSLMEPRTVDPAGYRLLNTWQKKYRHVHIADFSYNPLALYLFFQKHRKKLTLIGPQFHIIITAQLCGVPYLPVAYDNKVARLLEETGGAHIPINNLSLDDIQSFIDRGET